LQFEAFQLGLRSWNMNPQSCEIHNLGISSPTSKFWHFRSHFQTQAFPHFNVTFATNHKVYYKEEGGGLLPSLGYVSVMKSM